MTQQDWNELQAIIGCIALIVFGLVLLVAGVLVTEHLDNAHIYCREAVLPGDAHDVKMCPYPEQTLAIEQGMTRKLLLCRCRR